MREPTKNCLLCWLCCWIAITLRWFLMEPISRARQFTANGNAIPLTISNQTPISPNDIEFLFFSLSLAWIILNEMKSVTFTQLSIHNIFSEEFNGKWHMHAMMMTRQKKLCESHVVWCVIELDNRQTICGVQYCDVRCHEKREIKFLIARDMVSQIWIQVACGLHAPILKSTAEKQRNWYMRTSNKSSQHNWQLFNIYKPHVA